MTQSTVSRRLIMSGLLYASTLLVACGGERPNDVISISQAQIDASLGDIVDQRLVPNIQSFRSRSEQLVTSANDLCRLADDTNQNIETVTNQLFETQDQWKLATQSWHRILPFNIGPLSDNIITPEYLFIDSFRFRGVDYLGTVQGTIRNLKDSTEPLTEESFQRLQFNRVGLIALESALHQTHPLDDTESSTELTAIAAELRNEPRKCQVIEGYSQQLELRAQQLENAWLVEFQSQSDPEQEDGSVNNTAYRDRFLNRQLNDDSDPLALLLTSIQQYLDFLRRRDAAEGYQPLTELGFETTQISLEELRGLLNGGPAESNNSPAPVGQAVPSLFTLMALSGNPLEVDAIKALFTSAFDAIDNQDRPTLYSITSELDGKFKREIPDALAIELGVTFSDGD